MSKLLAIIVLNIFLVCSVGARIKKGAQMMTDREKDDLVGSVRIVRTEIAKFVIKGEQHVEGPRVLSQTTTYDAEGHKTEEARYKEDGSLASKRVLSYDVEGKLIESARYEPNGSLRSKSVYTNAFDGKKLEEIAYNADGSIIDKTVRLFDDNGNPKELATYNADGSLMVKMVFAHDDRGRMTEMAFCIGKSEDTFIATPEEGQFVMLSDAAKNKMIGAAPCFDGLLVGRTIIKYDDKDNPTEQAEYLSDGSLASRRVFIINAQGRGRELAEYGADGLLRGRKKYVREVDAHGNWIKNIESKWNTNTGKFELTEAIHRIVTYY